MTQEWHDEDAPTVLRQGQTHGIPAGGFAAGDGDARPPYTAPRGNDGNLVHDPGIPPATGDVVVLPDGHETAVGHMREWNPLAPIAPEVVPLDASGGRAAVVCRRWTGRERLAYEDALTERMMTVDQDGEGTVRIGSLRVFALSLTVIGSHGFPPAPDGRTYFTGTREQREADLLAITDHATFEEVKGIALRVQPLPSLGGEDADDKKKKGDDGADPSRTLSTGPGAPTTTTPA